MQGVIIGVDAKFDEGWGAGCKVARDPFKDELVLGQVVESFKILDDQFHAKAVESVKSGAMIDFELRQKTMGKFNIQYLVRLTIIP